MKAWKFFTSSLLCIAFGVNAQSVFSDAYHAARDKGIQFILNVHTGQEMSPDEWLSSSSRSPEFEGFGGLKRMVQQTTAHARSYGGIRKLKINKSELINGEVHMEIQTFFVNDKLRKSSKSVAERENMVWRLKMVRVGEKWLIDFAR